MSRHSEDDRLMHAGWRPLLLRILLYLIVAVALFVLVMTQLPTPDPGPLLA